MKIKNLFAIAAVALGFAACSSNDEVIDAGVTESLSTYVGVELDFSGKMTKAALGSWGGRDEIQNVTVFLVNAAKNKIDYTTFSKESFKIEAGKLTPGLAVKSTAGDKVDVYAIVNGEESIVNNLKLGAASDFEDKYNTVVSTLASRVAKMESEKEVVMMTNDQKYTIEVAAGVSKEAAVLSESKNKAKVKVERIVSRALVTKADDMVMEVKSKLYGKEVTLAKITKIEYGVGQSNTSVYLTKQGSTVNPLQWDAYDNSGLVSKEVLSIGAKSNATIVEALSKEAESKFVLPVVQETYTKGNTTYFEVVATFTPNTDLVVGEYTPESTVYLGVNDNKFYVNKDEVIATGQMYYTYTNSKMKYVLWLNPNDLSKPTSSPTVRNQVYHAHITGFKEMGLPNNPLNPEDPTPEDPNTPTNPIDPKDPLVTEKTYLSASISVVEWGLHSYSMDLGNEY